MESIILAAVLNFSALPVCQQWLDRVDRESRHVVRLVTSPRRIRHIKRMNFAAQQARIHCAELGMIVDVQAKALTEGGGQLTRLQQEL